MVMEGLIESGTLLFGKNIYCTILEYMFFAISKLPGLSLVIPLSIARVLKSLGFETKLK